MQVAAALHNYSAERLSPRSGDTVLVYPEWVQWKIGAVTRFDALMIMCRSHITRLLLYSPL